MPLQLNVDGDVLTVTHQVGLLNLRGCNQLLDARETGANLECPGGFLDYFDFDVDAVRARAGRRRDVDAFEVTQRGRAPA